MVTSKFVDCDRDQAFLLPRDLRDWIPVDDLGHFVIEAVDLVDLWVFKVNRRGTGSAQHHPRMMLALLIYCHANGIFSSRRIERATYRDIGVRFVAANHHPDHDTIASFRRENVEAIAESFLQVLLLAKEWKLLKLGVVSVDGSKIDANASKRRSVTYQRAGELVDQLTLEIADLMARAEKADAGSEADPQALPKELGRMRVPAVRYAVFWHDGPVDTVRETWDQILWHWLPRSGMRSAHTPDFEVYDERFDPRTGLGGIEIWVGVVPAT